MAKGEPGARSSVTPADEVPAKSLAGQPDQPEIPTAAADGAAPVEPAMVDRGMQAQLGQQLRALFDHVASEPVPERLLKLLEDLEGKEKKR